MVEEGVPRRRRRRRRDGRGGVDQAAPRAQPATAPEWQWRTFPVLFSFVVGGLVMAILIGTEPGAYYVFLYGALFCLAFGAAHIVTRRMAARRRRQ